MMKLSLGWKEKGLCTQAGGWDLPSYSVFTVRTTTLQWDPFPQVGHAMGQGRCSLPILQLGYCGTGGLASVAGKNMRVLWGEDQ